MSTNGTTTHRTRRQAAIDRALAKAHEQARAGNVPTLIRARFTGDQISELWSVGSRTQAGQVYLVELQHDRTGVETICDCAAADREVICWHRAATRLAHLDQIASHNAAGVRIRPRRPAAMAAD